MKKQFNNYRKIVSVGLSPDEISDSLILQWRKRVVGQSIIEVTWNSYHKLKTIFKFGIEKQPSHLQRTLSMVCSLEKERRKGKYILLLDLKKLEFWNH